MAVRRSYTLIDNLSLDTGGTEYEGDAFALNPEDDCINLFIEVGDIIGIPGDGFTPFLQTSPDGVNWGTIHTGSKIDTGGAYYLTPSGKTDFYPRPDSYIRLYFTKDAASVINNLTIKARIGSLTRRGRYGH